MPTSAIGLRFFADSNSCNMIGTPQNCEADAQDYWASCLLKIFLLGLAYFFQLGYWEQIFYFQSYGNLIEKNIMCQQL